MTVAEYYERMGYEKVDGSETSVEGLLKPCPFCGCKAISAMKRWNDECTLENVLICRDCEMAFMFCAMFPHRNVRDIPREVAESISAKSAVIRWNTRRVPIPVEELMDIHRRLGDFIARNVLVSQHAEEANAIRNDLLMAISRMYP